jgi:hypothetical protein
MNEARLKRPTKAFALRVLELVDAVPDSRSGPCQSRSAAEMISKLAVVEEESDESGFWPELIGVHGRMSADKLEPLMKEADESTAIMVACRRTLGSRNRESGIENRKSS